MKTLFIFPPGWNPSSPYLALPILKSYIQNFTSASITIKDVNLEFFEYIFDEEYLRYCLNKITFDNLPEYKRNSILLFRDSISEIEYAKGVIRTEEYLNPSVKIHVDAILSNAIYIINAAWDGLKISFNGIDLKYDKCNSLDVYNACEDYGANPFIEFYYSNLIPFINKMGVEFLGLSVTGHSQLISSLTLCKMVKKYCPCVKHISLGGNYITRASEMICNCGYFNEGFFDSIMLYDGEISCKELTQALIDGSSLKEVHNIIYYENQRWLKTEFITNDIVNTCTPDFSDLPLNKYFAPATIYPIFTSRSCYNKCAFCTIPNATSGRYRALPLEDVTKNIKILKDKYNAQFITIVDETFDITRMVKFANALLSEHIKIYWYCETRFSPQISYETCELLYKSGCRQIQFGLESYNQRVLDKMGKHTKIEWIDNAIDNCFKAKIPVHLFFFTGFPTETFEEALNTYQYTSKKVADSQLKYNIVSSRGYGTFGLEIGSTVYLQPEKFGVTLINNSKENDLRLNLDYNVETGLSQKESEELVNSQNLREGFLKKNTLGVELPFVDFVPEIHMVIKAKDSHELFSKKVSYVLSDDSVLNALEKDKICIPNWISIVKSKTSLYFYNSHLNQVYVLPLIYVKGNICTGESVWYTTFFVEEKEMLMHLALLHHFSFIEIENIDKRDVILIENTILCKSNDLQQYYNNILDEWIIHNIISRDTVAVSKLSYKLLELFDEPLSFGDFIELLKKSGIELSKIKLFKLINYYLQHDIIYALD